MGHTVVCDLLVYIVGLRVKAKADCQRLFMYRQGEGVTKKEKELQWNFP